MGYFKDNSIQCNNCDCNELSIIDNCYLWYCLLADMCASIVLSSFLLQNHSFRYFWDASCNVVTYYYYPGYIIENIYVLSYMTCAGSGTNAYKITVSSHLIFTAGKLHYFPGTQSKFPSRIPKFPTISYVFLDFKDQDFPTNVKNSQEHGSWVPHFFQACLYILDHTKWHVIHYYTLTF